MPYTGEGSGPVGVGGWMILFIFGFCITTPLTLLAGTYASLYSTPDVATALGGRWLIYQICEWLLVALGIAITAYVWWRLLKVQNPQTIRLVIYAIPLVALGLKLLDVLLTSIIGQIKMGLLFSGMGIELVRAGIYCVIWCAYFTVSKRVKNTYYAVPDSGEWQVFE
jgi:Protein of unknown function (DUF2569)